MAAAAAATVAVAGMLPSSAGLYRGHPGRIDMVPGETQKLSHQMPLGEIDWLGHMNVFPDEQAGSESFAL